MGAETFGEAGERLFAALASDSVSYAVGVLIVEACRIADRLDELNRCLTGDTNVWLRLTEGRDEVLEVRVDAAMQEARQQATVLRQLLAEIRRQTSGDEGEPDDDLDGL
jgi:hypothetical protein